MEDVMMRCVRTQPEPKWSQHTRLVQTCVPIENRSDSTKECSRRYVGIWWPNFPTTIRYPSPIWHTRV